jgi:uncharacterized protein YqeY
MNRTIQEDIKQAMRDKNTTKLNVLRALKNSITNTALTKGSIDQPVSDIEIMGLIRKEISKRQDSIAAFVSATRQDLIDKEQAEIDILTPYLPAELSDEDLEKLVIQVICHHGVDGLAPTKRDMGKIIKDVVVLVDGKADNRRISKMVGEKLP